MASEADIPETGAVFTFGRCRFAGNEPSRFWVRNDRILQLACGDEHTALVTESGRIFTFGLNEWGQLGLGDTSPRDKPSCIKDLKNEKVDLVACGRTHSIVTTESGQLYTFGSNGEGQLGVKDINNHTTPIRVDSFPPNTKHKMVAAGVDHSVCLTENGCVYVWGGNSEGQLGTGSNGDHPVPTLLSAVKEPIIAIAVGYYHTALLTEKGSVFVFGEVDSGKLGLGNGIKSCCQPQKLSLGCHRIQAVSCGGSHTILLTDQKEVYTFGNGENGQLGHGTLTQQISIPEKLNLSFKVTDICCGENHTALLSEDGYLYTCGDGRHGKLGQGKNSYSNQFQPSRLIKFDPFIVDKVACGGCHMMVLAHHRSLSNGDSHESETKLSLDGNDTLLENILELSGSLSARDRRRQTTDSSFSSLNRTLPSLSGKSLSLFRNNSDHLQNSISAVEVRHLPRLKNSLSLGNVSKANVSEDGEGKENKSTTHLNEDEWKSSSNENNVMQPVKSISEIPKPKAAPRTLRPVEARNGHAATESGSNDLLEESHLPIVDVAKKKNMEEQKTVNDDVQSIEEVANQKKSPSHMNGFSTGLSNGNSVSPEINDVEAASKEKKKKKKKKKTKEEKGKVKMKDKEKMKEIKESSEGKEKLESDTSETEELESKDGQAIREEKSPKKVPKKLEEKKTKKQKDNEKKQKKGSEEEEEEEEEEEVEEEDYEDSEEEKKEKKNEDSPDKKNSKYKGGKKLQEKKEEEEKEVRSDKKKTKEGGGGGGDNKEEEKAKADPIDKLVFAEDLNTKSENEENAASKKSNTCTLL